MTRATTFRATAIVGGFLLALLMIMTVSRAAFSDTTSNDANYVGSGSLVLYNNAPNGGDPGVGFRLGDETGDEMFGSAGDAWTVDASGLTPGDSVSHCIEIIHGGSVPANVALASVASDAPSVPGFRAQIDLTVERFAAACDTGTATPVASGTLAAPAISETAWSTAVDGPSEFYVVTLTLNSGAGNSFQGASVSNINFEWLAGQA